MSEKFKYYSPSAIKNLFQNSDAAIRKKWGQNFLIDPNISRKIAELLTADTSGSILEIGPGLGVLTKQYLESGRDVFAVEIDAFLVDELKKEFSEYKNLHLFNQDAVVFIHDLIAGTEQKDTLHDKSSIRSVGGNLPYYITSELLTNIVFIPGLTRGVFLVQKEYAMRCVVEKSESSLNVFLNNFGKWKIAMKVPPPAFFPVPGVHSSVLVFEPFQEPVCDASVLQTVLRMSFRGRRKKIKNAWAMTEGIYSMEKMTEAAEEAQLSVQKRPEEITREEFYHFTECLKKII